MKVEVFNNNEDIATYFADKLIELVKSAHGKSVHVALSGGSTPKAIFKTLTEKYGKTLALPELHFWWGDDRCVEPTNDDSNYKWAKEFWLEPIGISEENIHRVMGENDPYNEAIRYAKEIMETLPLDGEVPVFDFQLLGLGEDGHTASIFPHEMELLNSAKVCEVAIHPESGQKRITLTGKVLNQSKIIAFLAIGEKKAQKVFEIIKDQNKKLPAANIENPKGELIWLLDDQSSRLL